MAAHIRTIKHEFFLNEELAALPALSRLAFIGLWTLADREGRVVDRPRRIRAELFPYEPEVDMEAVLDSLCPRFLQRYSVDGSAYLQIVTFARHQRPNLREPASQIPGPHMNARASTGEHMQDCHDHTAAPEGREGEGKGREGKAARPPLVAPGDDAQGTLLTLPVSVAPPLMTFPTVKGALAGADSWDLTARETQLLQSGFPDLDVMAECRRALVWIESKRDRRKTAGGMLAFLNGWMSRSQNRGTGGKTNGHGNGHGDSGIIHRALPESAASRERNAAILAKYGDK